MVRKALILVGVAMVVAAPSAGAKPAPQPLAPDQAAAAAAGPAVAAKPIIRRITLQQALADGASPGAIVEAAPGFTAGQVGIDTLYVNCYSGQQPQQWGYWPYDLTLTDHTDWCGYPGGAITYRSTVVTEATTLCSTGSTSNYRLSGGVGYTYVAWEDQGNFSCPTSLPWLSYHYNKWIDMLANTSGEYVEYNNS